MVSVWNSRPGQGDGGGPRDAGSLAPGANLDRRRFVELAAGAVAGVTLAGLPAPAAAEADGRPVDDPCSGKGRSGPAAEVLEYGDLAALHRAWR
jgi:hypothetical protein